MYMSIGRDKNLPFRLLILNCQSIIAKKPNFLNLINEHKPDFIAGTESWLSDSIHNNEIFPSTYSIYRYDRADGYRSLESFCSMQINYHQWRDFTRGFAACRVSLSSESIILISVYRRPNNNYQYLTDLCSTIDSIINSNPNDIIWLAGDLNFPNIDWKLNCL